MIMEVGKSKICRVVQQARDQNGQCCSSSPKVRKLGTMENWYSSSSVKVIEPGRLDIADEIQRLFAKEFFPSLGKPVLSIFNSGLQLNEALLHYEKQPLYSKFTDLNANLILSTLTE